MVACPLRRGLGSSQGHMQGVTSAQWEQVARTEATARSACWGGEGPCSHGLQTGLTTEQTVLKEPFSVVFSITVGWGVVGPVEKHPKAECTRCCPCTADRAPRAGEPCPDGCPARPASSRVSQPFRLTASGCGYSGAVISSRPDWVCVPLRMWRSLGCTAGPHQSSTRALSGGQRRLLPVREACPHQGSGGEAGCDPAAPLSPSTGSWLLFWVLFEGCGGQTGHPGPSDAQSLSFQARGSWQGAAPPVSTASPAGDPSGINSDASN